MVYFSKYFHSFQTLTIYLILFHYYCANHHCLTSDASGPCVLLDPEGSLGSLCIPVESINRAFSKARYQIGLLQPFTGPYINHHHEEIDKLGLSLTETSRILAKEFQLSWYQIHKFLPTLDVSLTEILDFCPVQFRHTTCSVSRYRTLTGHCNNLQNPQWGAILTPFVNILPPTRRDGISAPRQDTQGEDLPSARLVSSVMHGDAVVHEHSITIMLIAWGQIIDHDITLTGDTKDSVTLKEPECCEEDQPYGQHKEPLHHNCFPIEIPQNDPFYRKHGRRCLNFLRSFTGVRPGCRLGPRVAFNTITSYLDANFAYGSSPELGAPLRAGKFGLLKSFPVFQEYGLKPLLPPKMEDPDDGCIRPNPDVFCFLAGDTRVNEQLVLTVLHTLFMREHNRIAENLHLINPHWDDELIFQEARRIVIATTQHITFNEFLPMVLGKELMHKYGLSLQEKGYWDGYDPNVNPTAADEFITSAFRFGHSLLPSRIERWSLGHRYIDSEPLHKLLRQPYDVYRPGYIDTFIMGMVNQLAQAMDEGVTEQVTTLLFKEPKRNYGMDLAAMNIQRGREHGIPGFTAYREICGLSPISTWDDLFGVMRNHTIYKYRSIYKSPHDIDLWSGGVSEISGPGALLGPTFGCIVSQQFQAIKYGDRYWYELPNFPSSFTPAQLEEIRKVKLSRLLCDNSDNVKTIQMYAMVFPDPDINPRLNCHGAWGRINFEHWREVPTESHHYPPVNNPPPPPSAETPEHLHYSKVASQAQVLHTISNVVNDSSPFTSYSSEERQLDREEVELKNLYRVPAPRTSKSMETFHVPPSTTTTTTTTYMENPYETEVIHHHHHHEHIVVEEESPVDYAHNIEGVPSNNNNNNVHNNNSYQYPQSQPQAHHYVQSESESSGYTDFSPDYHYFQDIDINPNTDTNTHTNTNTNNNNNNKNTPYILPKVILNPETSSLKLPLPPEPPFVTHTTRKNQRIRPTKNNKHHVKNPKNLPRIKPFPENHPFPGMDGLFSPNPGYLTRQKFQVYKTIPYNTTPRPTIWQKILG